MTEAERLIAEANTSETITDSRGRQLEVRRTTKREVRRLMRACGAACDIDRWFGEGVLAAQVRAIDTVPVLFPTSPDAVDALVERLDNDGLDAVGTWAAGLVNTVVDDAKNLPRTPIS